MNKQAKTEIHAYIKGCAALCIPSKFGNEKRFALVGSPFTDHRPEKNREQIVQGSFSKRSKTVMIHVGFIITMWRRDMGLYVRLSHREGQSCNEQTE